MHCFICRKGFPSYKKLLMHIKYIHGSTCGPFHCTEKCCFRIFSSMKSFKKHISNYHFNQKELINTDFNDNDKMNIFVENQEPDKLSLKINQEKSNNHKNDQNASSECETHITKFKDKVYKFISILYVNNSIPRSEIQNIIKAVKDLFDCDIFRFIKTKYRAYENVDDKGIFDKCFDILFNPFKELETEYKRFKHFEESGFFIKPVEKVFNETVIVSSIQNYPITKVQRDKSVVIPLRGVLKFFFEVPGVYDDTITFLKKLSNPTDNKENFIQGDLWTEKMQNFQNKTFLPLFVYFDDFETGNTLGSHAGDQKLGAVYISIPCLPKRYAHNLSNTFLVQLFKSNDRKKLGNTIFSPLVDELKYLKNTGITIGDKKTLYFDIGLFIGDNLGLNSILGYVESFSANYFCRFCKTPKQQTHSQLHEDKSNLRTPQNYSQDIELSDYSITGIKENSLFNEIEDFHVTYNYSVDIMHDILEGVCIYDLCLILKYFIFEISIFSLATLNSIISTFDYGENFISNKPPILKLEHLQRDTIKMSAAEMHCFLLTLGVMIGHFIPEQNDYWNLYISLRKICDIIFNVSISMGDVDSLKTLISEHHFIYSSLLHQNLKPKHHHMIHYPNIILKSGPLVNIWSMRFEAKHKSLKNISTISCSKKDICWTIALRHQIRLCFNFITLGELSYDLVHGNSKYIDDERLISQITECMRCPLKNPIAVKWVIKNDKTFRVGDILYINGCDQLTFGEIKRIILTEDNQCFFEYLEYKSKWFNDHVHAYEVETAGENNLKVIDSEKLLDNVSCLLTINPKGDFYVTSKYSL